MQWTHKGSRGNGEIFELQDNGSTVIDFHFNKTLGSIRLTTDHEKRVFLVTRQGMLRNKTILRNEYGFRLGKLSYDQQNSLEGMAEFDGTRYLFRITRERMFLFREGSPADQYQLDLKGEFFIHEKENVSTLHSLLLVYCYYVRQFETAAYQLRAL